MFQSQRFFAAAVGVLILGGLIFVIIRDGAGLSDSTATTTPEEVATTAEEVATTAQAKTTPETVSVTAGLGGQAGVSFLSRKPVFSSDIPAHIRVALGNKITQLQEKLAANPYDAVELLNLAIQFKTAGDYQTAREIWEFMAKKSPKDPIPLHNLGELYHHYLKDFPKSEEAFLSGIAANNKFALNYIALHELYRYSYKQNTSAAADILLLGVSKVSVSASVELYAALGDYYRSKGDKENAIKYYTSARDAARIGTNQEIVDKYDALIKEIGDS